MSERFSVYDVLYCRRGHCRGPSRVGAARGQVPENGGRHSVPLRQTLLLQVCIHVKRILSINSFVVVNMRSSQIDSNSPDPAIYSFFYSGTVSWCTTFTRICGTCAAWCRLWTASCNGCQRVRSAPSRKTTWSVSRHGFRASGRHSPRGTMNRGCSGVSGKLLCSKVSV